MSRNETYRDRLCDFELSLELSDPAAQPADTHMTSSHFFGQNETQRNKNYDVVQGTERDRPLDECLIVEDLIATCVVGNTSNTLISMRCVVCMHAALT